MSTITKTLTGRQRHRAVTLMFKPTILVLQVEEHFTGIEIGPDDETNQVDCLVWRDATVEDMIQSSTKFVSGFNGEVING